MSITSPVKQGDRKYNMTVTTYTQGGQITVQRGCFAYMITNTGDEIVTLNGMVLYPGLPGTRIGDSRSISGHKNDIYAGNMTLTFAGGGAAPGVEIIQLYYAEYQ